MTPRAHLAPLAALLLAAGPAAAASPQPSPPFNPEPPACAFTLLVDHSGVHQLTFADLQQAAGHEDPPPPVEPIAVAKLHLTHLGETVPIWIEDGGDGLLGPGDHLEFLGEPPAGQGSTYDEWVRFNAYRLDGCVTAPPGARGSRAALPAELPPVREVLRVVDHLEQDRLLLRFHQFGPTKERPERWYWAKITQIDAQPFRLPIDLRSYAPASGPLRLSLDLRGWSYGSGSRYQMKDHQLEVTWNGRSLGTFESDGQERLRIDLPELPAAAIIPGKNTLGLRIPARQAPDGQPIIDVLMLNWVELEFPRRRRLEADQQRLVLAPRSGPTTVVLSSEEAGELKVYDDDGHRWDARSYRKEKGPEGTRFALAVPEKSQVLRSVANGAFRRPAKVEVDHPSHLKSPDNQADYLMIVHPSLWKAAEPLAKLHRRRGLEVAMIDVRDIFEEYGYGMHRPEAIQAFVDDAYHHWRAPRPRFVLLVGDASWDSRGEEAADENYADWTYQPGESLQFVKNRSTPYADAGKISRDLIPAWTWEMYQGHAASDNFYVSVDGNDNLPDLAIGRLPIASPEELAGIVGKIEKYVARIEAPKAEPWQRKALFISNQEAIYQSASDQLAALLSAEGLEVQKVYPRPDGPNNKESVEALTSAFDEGRLLVHFIGHGGRYIWRTGPEDLQRNNDLFTLKDLDALTPTDGFPFVLSMTCYSAPFDHPTADSIGEKLLRLPDKGAIAVLAAAWRNSPPAALSERILEELQVPGRTIGEAVMAGKRRDGISEEAIRQYNLLGDPALPLAIPVELRRGMENAAPAVETASVGASTDAALAPKAAEPAVPASEPPLQPEWLRNRIRWQTASEVDNFGYDVYRGPTEDGPFAKVTATPVPGHGTTDEPSAYEWYDASIEEGVEYWYYVESISISGERERFTPIFEAKAKTRTAAAP